MSIARVRVVFMVLVAFLGLGPVAEAQRMAAREVAERAESAALGRPVTVTVRNVSFEQAVKAIAQAARVRIQYQMDLIEQVDRPVTLEAKKVPLRMVLDRVLVGTTLYVVSSAEDVLTLRAMPVASQVQGVVVGKVTNGKTKAPLAGVRVLIGDAQSGIATGEDGMFRLTLEVGEQTIHFRGLGFGRQTRRVMVKEGETATLEVTLESTASVLDEVIVTGTVTATQRREIATPITVITAEDIERRGITRITDLFRGEIPGVYAAEDGIGAYRDSELGGLAKTLVYVRGSADLNGNPNPLKTYIDGIEVMEGGYLGTIDPQTIERIEIITGPQAASIYGSGAMGGVMQIFTKRGSGLTSQQLTLALRYGILQNNMATGRTPTHNDVLTLAGGIGSMLTYSGTVSYNYTGQWQPGLFTRSLGTSVGLSVTQGSFSISGSANATTGANGTAKDGNTFFSAKAGIGAWRFDGAAGLLGGTKGTSSSQTFSVSANQIIVPSLSHSGTIGINYNSFALIPERPSYRNDGDTLYRFDELQGSRTTASYNMTYQPAPMGILSSVFTLGANYTAGRRLQVRTEASQASATGGFVNSNITRPHDETSWGYFAQWRLGLFSSMYWTFGVRAELNPAYGMNHKIDWVPANGLAYNINMGDVTLKLMASYGRATRAPNPDIKSERGVTDQEFDPVYTIVQFENQDLTPEYSRGPQGGIELYMGNLGFITLNHYRQKVDNLIQQVVVDSIERKNVVWDYSYFVQQNQYQNTASITQKGWEGTGALNLGPVSLAGTYSWADARVASVNRTHWSTSWMYPGMVLSDRGSRTGSMTVGVSHGSTSATIVSNWTGAVNTSGNDGNTVLASEYEDMQYARIRTYGSWFQYPETVWTKISGFWRSDISIYQRMTPKFSLTLNVKNAGNNYASHTFYISPILGRTTTFGASYRW